MIDKKLRSYEAPTTYVLELRSEESILVTSNYGAIQSAGLGFSLDEGNLIDYTTGADF